MGPVLPAVLNSPPPSRRNKRPLLLALPTIVALLATSSLTSAQSVRIVTTVAGLTRHVYGNGGPAAEATINYSGALVADSAGNLYLADTLDHQIRKIDASTGDISPVAGTGQAGYSGDGQLAVNAQLDFPEDMAVDAAGNLYIADTGNEVIRKVSAATGIITTIAGTAGEFGYSGDGGAATKAVLNSPSGVAVDSSGNVYIADSLNFVIRKVTAATGIITVVAGTPGQFFAPGVPGGSGDGGPATAAKLGGPEGVALDPSGNFYIADEPNCVVRKVTAATGTISTYAGDNTCGDSGDDGPATSAELGQSSRISLDSAGNLYLADFLNNVIRKVTASTGIITTIAGNGAPGFSGDGGSATNAALSAPIEVAPTGSGAIYIADRNNLRIREVSAAGIISTFAGNGIIGPLPGGVSATSAPLGLSGYRWYNSVAADSSGNIYFADGLNNAIRKVTPAGVISTIAGNGQEGYSGDGGPSIDAEFYDPSGLAFDSQGNLYVSDSGNNVVRKINASTGTISTYAGTYARPNSGGTYPNDTGDGGPATSAGLPEPAGLAVDSAGNLYIAEFACAVRKVTPAGIISAFAGQAGKCSTVGTSSGDGGPATSATLSGFLNGLAIDSQGNVFIGDDTAVRKVTASTGIITTVVGTESVANGQPDSGDGGPAASATLSQIYGLAIDPAGNLYIADDYTIRTVTSAGIISTAAGQANEWGYSGDGGLATSALISPEGVAADNSGNIYFTDVYGDRIRKVSTASSTQQDAVTPVFDPSPGDFGSAPVVTITTTTPGAQIFYTLDGSVPNPGTSPLYTAPLTLVAPMNLSAIAIAPGYSTSGTATGTYTTGQAAQTITFGALPNVTYGASPIMLDATASSGLPVSYSVTGPATVSGSTLTITGAGSVTVTASQPGNSDYVAASPVARSFTVGKAPLTITADNATITVGGPSPVFNYTITGFVNQDGVGSIEGYAFEATTATITSPPGTYPITFSTEAFTSPNYTFNYVNGTLTINAAVTSAPVVILSPASLTFPSQAVGSTSTAQTLTLTNSGNATLAIASIAASGDFAETNTCGTNLAPGSGCAISATFAPMSGGPLTGALTITDNAANSSQTVSLSGTGSDVDVSTSSTGLTTSPGGTTTANIQLSSAGGFSGTVNLTCSVAYMGAGTAQHPPICSLNPAQEQVSTGTSVTATLTVTTTASGASARLSDNWLHAGGGALAALFFFIAVPRRRRWTGLGLLVVLGIITLGTAIGCGGGSSTAGTGGGTQTNPGTTTGNYQVTVQATSGTASVSIAIPLSVN